ncbi:hypothetical protein NDU88_000236 [Pleurodeles waltl]|uniref:Uncharacterized protein n=1 Tax=Pleurodeles waltl TaxID=8319 RepID=A0AAV7Q6T6_PLEWA|nr:hypothetical protein NDU88_000236 [Pleurodeles waltl]
MRAVSGREPRQLLRGCTRAPKRATDRNKVPPGVHGSLQPMERGAREHLERGAREHLERWARERLERRAREPL